MTYRYRPRGVCSRELVFEIEDGKVQSFYAVGGCNGNLQGISHLIQGMPVQEVIERLEGIQCGPRTTSCPDQISKALKAYQMRGSHDGAL